MYVNVLLRLFVVIYLFNYKAKDRSLADVVAHEISHSWTGNLVTNNSCEHFWYL